MALCSLFVWQRVQAHDWVRKLTAPRLTVCILVFLLAVCAMFTQTYNPFLYFQF
jgi:alginate O-acetyltransferase complex protein AlgI